jgi:hypothetical protein
MRFAKGVAVLAAASALIAIPQAFAAGTQEATCEKGPVMIGSGSADWRRTSLDAGPLGFAEHPLSRMSRTRNGQFVAKMPALIEGHSPVTLSVPPRLRHRVGLYYGFREGPNGERTTLLTGPGFSEVVFQPCTDKPRTIWPGGIRVKGRGLVRLLVKPEGGDPIPLVLGRPRLLPTPTS